MPKCKKCRGKINAEAALCPHCGALNPVPSRAERVYEAVTGTLKAAAIWGAAILIGWFVVNRHPTTTPEVDSVALQEKTTSADTVEFDPDLQIKKAMFDNLAGRVSICAHDAMLISLRQGERSREALLNTATNMCGEVVQKYFASQNVKDPYEAAKMMVQLLATNELETIIHDGR